MSPPPDPAVDGGRDLDRRVADRLGRLPQGAWEVVAWSASGDPVVIRNAPLLDDGRPMPTRYWLIDPALRSAVGRLEARAACAGPRPRWIRPCWPEPMSATRPSATPRCPSVTTDPAPREGSGGTRMGVKCLHAHYAWYLAGGDDPVGDWVAARLVELT